MMGPLIQSSDGELPMVRCQTVRTISLDGETFVAIFDLAEVLEADRSRLVKRLAGRARLVTAIDRDAMVRNVVVAPVDAFIRRKAQATLPLPTPPSGGKLMGSRGDGLG